MKRGRAEFPKNKIISREIKFHVICALGFRERPRIAAVVSGACRDDHRDSAPRPSAQKAKSEARVPRSTRLLRPKAIQAKLGIGHTKFWEDFVRTGRIKLVDVGPNAKACPEYEVDDVIAEMIAERDAKLLNAKSEVA